MESVGGQETADGRAATGVCLQPLPIQVESQASGSERSLLPNSQEPGAMVPLVCLVVLNLT